MLLMKFFAERRSANSLRKSSKGRLSIPCSGKQITDAFVVKVHTNTHACRLCFCAVLGHSFVFLPSGRQPKGSPVPLLLEEFPPPTASRCLAVDRHKIKNNQGMKLCHSILNVHVRKQRICGCRCADIQAHKKKEGSAPPVESLQSVGTEGESEWEVDFRDSRKV